MSECPHQDTGRPPTDGCPPPPPLPRVPIRSSANRWRRWVARVLFLPTLAWNFLLARVVRRRHWWDQIDDAVYMGALPFAWDVPALRRLGIEAVVNTCEEYAGPLAAYRRAGIEQLHIPTVDFTAPSLEHVQRGVAFMADQIRRGRRVYVHCKAGRARSGTVVLCWLMADRGMSPDEAQARILQRRPHAHRHLARRRVVRDFWEQWRGDPSGEAPSLNP